MSDFRMNLQNIACNIVIGCDLRDIACNIVIDCDFKDILTKLILSIEHRQLLPNRAGNGCLGRKTRRGSSGMSLHKSEIF